MDATVDDLTNYLGPDPNASGDGGFTKVWSFTAGQTWTLKPTLLLDTTFGFARQKQDVLGPDFDAGNFGLDVLEIPGTNDQNNPNQTFRERYAGYPSFNTGLANSTGVNTVGNRDGWNPIFRDERTYSIAANLSKLAGRHDIRGGYSINFLLSRSLAARKRTTRAAPSRSRATPPRSTAARLPTSTTRMRRS